MAFDTILTWAILAAAASAGTCWLASRLGARLGRGVVAGSAALAGLVHVAFAPDCLCRDPVDHATGSAIVAAVTGVVVTLVALGVRAVARRPQA